MKYISILAMTVSLLLLSTAVFAYEVTYSYDDNGRLASATYDSGIGLTYTHDKAGNMTAYTVTSSGTPIVTTAAVSSITETAAVSGGNVTSTGASSVTARGVCWSTSQNPTIADAKTVDSSGTGGFTSSITGLSPLTTYHARAYATNSDGTGYGNDVSFTTTAATLYVCSDGSCGGKPNCHKTIVSAVAAAESGSIIKVANNVTYSGDVTVSGKSLTIQGGWNISFSSQSGTTTLQGAPKVSNGSVTMQEVNIVP